MGNGGDEDREEQEDEPGEAGSPCIGLIDAEPSEPRAEAVELVPRVRHASREGFVLVQQPFTRVAHNIKIDDARSILTPFSSDAVNQFALICVCV